MFNENFILSNEVSKRIYNDFAFNLPVVDYHCHLKSDEIYKNVKFKNITDLWLKKDHYKWRLMRANGIEERLITGDGSDKEKFFAWAETIERCIGNPLYQWTHMELKKFFNIDESLNLRTAESIWLKTNKQLGDQGFGAQDFISKSNVKVICTTDHPLSDLDYHKKIAEESFDFQVLPTFRLDDLFQIDDEDWINTVRFSMGTQVEQLSDYLLFIKNRIDYFGLHGCKSADLGIGELKWRPIESDVEVSFSRIIDGEKITSNKILDIKNYLLQEILKLIYSKSWVFQLHFGSVGIINNL